MALRKAYPRATLKKIIKGHVNKNTGKGVDHLVSKFTATLVPKRLLSGLTMQVFIDYALFIQE
jgi:hypothetical protein